MKIDKPGIGLKAGGQRLDVLVGRPFLKREQRLEILLRAHIIPWEHLNPPETSQQHIFCRPTAYSSQRQEMLADLLVALGLQRAPFLLPAAQHGSKLKDGPRLLAAEAQRSQMLWRGAA